MSDAEKSPADPPPEQTPPPNGLGVLFIAAALALALVLSFVALVAYMAFSPPRSVNPPSAPSAKPAHEGRLLTGAAPRFRRT